MLRRMAEPSENDEMRRAWKEIDVAYFQEL
jgi:hypothetical protein